MKKGEPSMGTGDSGKRTTSSRAGKRLADDIDDLRCQMAEAILKEASFTADPVIMISRQLDAKINEYMKSWHSEHRKAR